MWTGQSVESILTGLGYRVEANESRRYSYRRFFLFSNPMKERFYKKNGGLVKM